MRKLIDEFRQFVSRGNVIDMAVGVIIGTAFAKITNSLVNDIIMPVLGKLVGGIDLSNLDICIQEEKYNEVTHEIIQEGVYVGIGSFLVTVLDFFVIAFVVFFMIKGINKATRIFLKKQEAAEAAKGPSEEELLADILEELKKKNN